MEKQLKLQLSVPQSDDYGIVKPERNKSSDLTGFITIHEEHEKLETSGCLTLGDSLTPTYVNNLANNAKQVENESDA